MSLLEELYEASKGGEDWQFDLARALANAAERGVHEYVDYARNLTERRILKTLYKGNKGIADALMEGAEKTVGEYLSLLKKGEDGVGLLSKARALADYAGFYYEEAAMYLDRLEEYKAYLKDGHWVSAYLLWKDRPEEDMFDWRVRKGFEG